MRVLPLERVHLVDILEERALALAGRCATEFGLAMDVWGSLGLWLGYDLGPHAVIYAGLDVWLIHAQDFQSETDMTAKGKGFGSFVFVSPGLALSWTP